MRKIIPTLALASLSLPLISVAANAQTAPLAPAAVTSTPALARIVFPSNAVFQRFARSTELANSGPSTTATAWETISNDASLSEFASLVKAAGLESLFSGAGAQSTYFAPTNDAFNVLDPLQLARLKEPRFKAQAATIVRQLVATGRVSFSDFTRRLPTGLKVSAPVPVQSCGLSGGTFLNGLQIGASLMCFSYIPDVPLAPLPVDSVTADGVTLAVRTAVIPGVNFAPNHFRVGVGGAMLETADYPVKNGLLHTVDTLPIPVKLGQSLSDIVGR